jgi:uncharacterized coiled-coil DUF342 family protein
VNDDELDDDEWDRNMIEFQSRADEIKKRIEEHAEKLEEISDKVSEVLGVILIDEIEEFLREQDSQNDTNE